MKINKRTAPILIFLGLVIVIGIYFFSTIMRMAPQGHGSDGNYSFSESKVYLESKIDSFIQTNSLVERKNLDPPPNDNYYNQDPYFTITIDSVNFCLRYYGDSLDWSNNNSSELFIASITTVGSMKYSKEEKIKIVEDKFINKLGGKKVDE